jgi:hypothetical protein
LAHRSSKTLFAKWVPAEVDFAAVGSDHVAPGDLFQRFGSAARKKNCPDY